MKTASLIKVQSVLNEVIRLPYGKAPDTELWIRLLDARSAVQVELFKEAYKNTGELPKVEA